MVHYQATKELEYTQEEMSLMKMLDKRYLCITKIGDGGFSEVYFALEKSSNEIVALKIMPTHSGELKKVFKKEVKILKSVDSNNVIGFKGAKKLNCAEGKFGMIILEKLEMDLLSLCLNKGSLSERTVKKIFFKICIGVLHCHQKGISHLDLKADNILLQFNKKSSHAAITAVKICDFGFAQQYPVNTSISIDQSVCKLSNGKIGTAEYRAPELHSICVSKIPAKVSLEKADVWSLGIILFSMITGFFPFLYEDSVRVSSHEFDLINQFTNNILCFDLVCKMLNDDYNKRPSIHEVISDPWFRSKH